jgi:hypothetical protein
MELSSEFVKRKSDVEKVLLDARRIVVRAEKARKLHWIPNHP